MVDLTSALTVASSVGLSVPTAVWLTKKFVSHRLSKDLEAYKDKLNRDRDEWQAALRERVESALGTKSAERDYEFSARKRLYTAIGPLRFQLVLACRDYSNRIKRHASKPFPTEIDVYYGCSFLYRILRPFAVSDLIERQMAYADFSVDPGAVAVLRFRRASFEAWTGGGVVLDHPDADWHTQAQHVFSDKLRCASNTLIMNDGRDRIAYANEFQSFAGNSENRDRLHPFPRLLKAFTFAAKPILWIRMVCFGLLCNDYVRAEGPKIGFHQPDFLVKDLLQTCPDP